MQLPWPPGTGPNFALVEAVSFLIKGPPSSQRRPPNGQMPKLVPPHIALNALFSSKVNKPASLLATI